jgi:putative toxin-antitoxin system antitoxin component (TIGR02293 family)
MSTPLEVRHILGLGVSGPPKSPMHWIDLAARGFPLSTLDRISRRLAPGDAAFKYRIVPKATLARAKAASGRLNPSQSILVVRLARIWSLALDVWGSDEAARRFLMRSHQLLDGRPPLDVALGSELGGDFVREILRRLQYGSAV